MDTNEPARHPAGGDEILYKDLSYRIVGLAIDFDLFQKSILEYLKKDKNASRRDNQA